MSGARWVGSVLVLAAILLAPAAGLPANLSSPVGLWRTFDDNTGRQRGLIRIWEVNGILYGRIEGTDDPADANRTCQKCRDDRKGKPIIGLNIIRGLKQDGDEWNGGEILDPENGQTYRCLMRLKNGGNSLVVRGYVGFSLLGRSQVWQRAE